MKTLSKFNFKNKTVLLRADLNSDVVNGKVVMSERIKQGSETIKELKRKGAKVVVLAHQGRKGKKDFISLKGHARLLNKFVKIKFVKDVVGKKAEKGIKDLKKGEVILLENVRFLDDEMKPEKIIGSGSKAHESAKGNKFFKLVDWVDAYVNDAFSVCHRKQASIVLFPKYLPSFAGRILEREVKALKKIKLKNTLYILAGAKPEDNIKLLMGNKVLAGGLFGQTCLNASGKALGAQDKYLKKEIRDYDGIKIKLKRKLKNVEMPTDFAVKIRGKREEVRIGGFPNKYEIYDIGFETIKKYVKEIRKAKAIYMKGPAGDCSQKQFCKGTFALLKAISNNKGFSLIGGGHLSDAIEASKINKKKFGHLSLSGGALLRYVAGEKLVGLEALK